MRTAVVTVGKELLTGRTVNTNLRTIAMKLKSIGIDVNISYVIDDLKKEFKRVLDFMNEDLIIFTGGLGPTVDDITRETVINYFDVETYQDQDTLDNIKAMFDKAEVEMKSSNNKQALFPVESVKLGNDLGTAPGVYFKVGKKRIILLPGPPHELYPVLDEAIEIIKNELDINLISRGFKLVGTGESSMENNLKGFYGVHPKVNVAPYANVGEIKYIFTSSDTDALDRAMVDFYNKYNQFIFGGLEDTLEGVVIDLLRDHGKVLAVAESCTGGMLSSRLINVSGASRVFKEGLITYANEAKMKYLDVKLENLKKFGAVSPEIAKEMCDNLWDKSDADITVSVTGIAGPNGGSEQKPVGLVYFGINFMGKTTIHRKVFNGNREMIRIRSVIFALNMLREILLKNENDETFVK
ncbi:Putative competence-damage inducible protein [Candidatus Izimaplasma bacterium HR1]|jgi:nicotinamide-nucleotide amidase|uniref:competence/damage-inducible protein A n=1 Tax=Candidatus Izimoplasma sp. HR1 TaxID=1541959 RepID=UPI0004F82D31|nr:Putative competence-damage inducible protein [Candidatus Izimaplasma bacterium HR1]